jgi:hypothetical protein
MKTVVPIKRLVFKSVDLQQADYAAWMGMKDPFRQPLKIRKLDQQNGMMVVATEDHARATFGLVMGYLSVPVEVPDGLFPDPGFSVEGEEVA